MSFARLELAEHIVISLQPSLQLASNQLATPYFKCQFSLVHRTEIVSSSEGKSRFLHKSDYILRAGL